MILVGANHGKVWGRALRQPDGLGAGIPMSEIVKRTEGWFQQISGILQAVITALLLGIGAATIKNYTSIEVLTTLKQGDSLTLQAMSTQLTLAITANAQLSERLAKLETLSAGGRDRMEQIERDLRDYRERLVDALQIQSPSRNR